MISSVGSYSSGTAPRDRGDLILRRINGLTEDPLADFLQEARVPLRLACNGASGTPLLASLWFVAIGDRLWCATQVDASVAKRLAVDSRCSFEVSEESMPYRGVRGRGTAKLHPERGPEILDALIERYLDPKRDEFASWLRARAQREVAIAIEAGDLVVWDYSKRMSAVK